MIATVMMRIGTRTCEHSNMCETFEKSSTSEPCEAREPSDSIRNALGVHNCS